MESWDHIIVWTVSTSIFILLKPIWIRKRFYFIALGALFFTPTPIYYANITGHVSLWPLIGSLPRYLGSWLGFDLWLYYVLPAFLITVLVFWAIAVWKKI